MCISLSEKSLTCDDSREARIKLNEDDVAWYLLTSLPEDLEWVTLKNNMPIDDPTKFTTQYIRGRLLENLTQ